MCNEQFLYLAASSTAEDSEFQATEKFNMIWRGLQYINHLLKLNTTMAGWIILHNTQVAI